VIFFKVELDFEDEGFVFVLEVVPRMVLVKVVVVLKGLVERRP
jgi:hypothetical protein